MKKELRLFGNIFGTTWHVKVVVGYFVNGAELSKKIQDRLEEINTSMSSYKKESEINQFNRIDNSDRWFVLSKDLDRVMKIAQRLYQMTDGAWDGTVRPLVDLWGFGPLLKKEMKIPDKEHIRLLRKIVGFHKIEIRPDGALRKINPGVTLDLASIAKGYAVDQIAALILENGYENFLVEIGGEIYAAGVRQDGKKWRVGINMPDPGAPFNKIYKVLEFAGKGFATSGDYRNYFTDKGKNWSHILDPVTGYPTSNRVVSVSVLADDCAFADGLATALMVMGPEKGIELVNKIKDVQCMILIRNKDGSLTDFKSTGFPKTG